MQQNPSQGIRNYSIDDVYTPSDSNSRRVRAHFDFVITDAQLSAYKAAHPTGYLDVGDIILSTAEGGSAPSLSELINRPISIYIDAHTDENDVFEFRARLSSTQQILSDEMISLWTGGTTPLTYVHVYSRCPYAIKLDNVTGGLALHSSPDTCVTIKGASTVPSNLGWSGIFYIGACKVEGTLNAYSRTGFKDNSGLTVVYEKCLGGVIDWRGNDASTRLKDNAEPGVVCAPWMSPTVDTEIEIPQGVSHEYGLYNRVAQARRLGSSSITIVATRGLVAARLSLNSSAGSEADGTATFVFQNGSERLTVAYNDDLLWSSSSGASAGKGVLVDTDLPAEFPGDPHNMRALTWSLGGVTSELSSMPSVSNPLSMAGMVELDWYTWDGLRGMSTIYVNDRSNLYIDATSLQEDVVYRINLHILNLAPDGGGRQMTVDTTNTPAELVLPDKIGSTQMPDFHVHFVDASGQLSYIWGWGLSSNKGGTQPYYNLHKHWHIASSHLSVNYSEYPQELAWGSCFFMLHGGKIVALLY